jgi:Domain of unknown function (DUF4166)
MNKNDPVLKQALGSSWSSLARVIQTHYGLSPFTDEQIHLRGIMDRVSYSSVAVLLMPFAVVAGALVPYRGRNVPVDATNESLPDRPEYFWMRTFHFPGKKPYTFRSAMVCSGDGELTEYVRFHLGIRFAVTARNGGLVERDLGYIWKIGRWSIPLPIHLLLGRSYVEEMPISDSEYEMKWTVTHPLFGETFAYNGRFSVIP